MGLGEGTKEEKEQKIVFMVPVMLFAALVPIGGLLFVQAEHDTRGFTEVPSPDEAVAEQVRKSKFDKFGPDSHQASGTRSSALLHAPAVATRGESRAYAYDTVRPTASLSSGVVVRPRPMSSERIFSAEEDLNLARSAGTRRTTEMYTNRQSLRSDIPPYVPPPPGALKKSAARPITTNLRSDLTGVIRYN